MRADFRAWRWVALLLCVAVTRLGAALYVVAPDGVDSAAGTEAAPWRTIMHAAAIATAGDIVEVRGGTYVERVSFNRSGTAEAPIVFRARAGETPVLDGATLTVGTGWFPFFWLHGTSHVTIQGFELRGLRTTLKNRVPIGILVTGSGAGVRLLDNRIHDMGTSYTGKSGGDAHGIAIYGDATTPISDLVVRGNHLHDLVLGSSEALVINGNVAGFLVEANRVHDCNNIGIDAIGHEDTCPDPAQDAARDGIIRLNTVYGVRSYGNPAYGNHYSAGGIYVDGGRDILIERNTVRECDIGIELASEHAGQATSRVHVRNNLIYRNRIGGLFMGGYDTQRGRTEDCVVEHNTFFENDTLQYDNGEIHLQFDVRTTRIRHNIIVANVQGLVIGNAYTQNTDNTVDFNLVHAPGAARWRWKNVAYAGWAAWRAGTELDEHSATGDPLFVDAAGGSFSLRAKSPAIDAGDPAFVPAAGETDHAGKPRVRGARTDIGAREFELLEFAAAGAVEPTVLEWAGGAGAARLTCRRRTDWAAQALAFEVQTATRLGEPGEDGWGTASGMAVVDTVAVSPADGTERVTFGFTPPVGTRWFARVRVSVAP